MPINPITIKVPAGPKPITTGPLSFANMLKMEKTVDTMYAGGFDKFAIPANKAPKGTVQSGFDKTQAYKLPLAVLMNDPKVKGSIYAVRSQNPSANVDMFALYNAKGKMLANRQVSDDYPQGFMWNNYQTT
jgi:hypothetical protein